jgi:histidinol-phosphatase
MDVPDERLKAAGEITRAASGLAAQRFLEGVPAGKKTDGTEVTPADIEVEELIRSLIAARFPGDGVTGRNRRTRPGAPAAAGSSTHRRHLGLRPPSQDLIYAGLGCWHQVNDGSPQRLTVSSTAHPRGAWVEMVNPATWSVDLLGQLHPEVLLLSTDALLDLVRDIPSSPAGTTNP